MKRNLNSLFYPKSIAAIGASNRLHTVGYALMKNLIESGFEGKVFPINLKYRDVQGVPVFRRVKDLPVVPDLAIIATPVRTVTDLLRACGEKGIRGICIISAGFRELQGEEEELYRDIRNIAAEFQLNIIGPNSLGFINPSIRLNASFANRMALPGKIAFISQSGALCKSILDWSLGQQFGFSHFVSIGSMLDIGFHDLIDYFGTDGHTACILIYMESLSNPRAFMSAARSFSRTKPIIVLKAGKTKAGAVAALTHTGVLAGNDTVFEAAFKRAGIVSVETVAQLFNVAQALAMQLPPAGNRLAIVTNSGGPGILATDYLIDHGGRLAELPDQSIAHQNKILPSSWIHKNPVEVLHESTEKHYAAAVTGCLQDKQVDGALVILTPQSTTDAELVAQELIQLPKAQRKTLLACWMGGALVKEGRKMLEQNKIPTYRFPESAVDVFLHMYSYSRNIALLYETPPNVPQRFKPSRKRAEQLMQQALATGEQVVDQSIAKQILQCYDIPVNESVLVTSAEGAVSTAEKFGYPVVLKIASPDITHKTEVKGVRLNIHSAAEVIKQYEDLIEKTKRKKPNAHISGVIVERMCQKRYELLIGAHRDEVFGPVIVFGTGGIGAEVFRDRNVALPPLNMALAQQLIEGTKIYQLLEGFRGTDTVDLEALKFILYKFSYLVIDFPEIISIDINPYAVDREGGIVLDARMVLSKEESEDAGDRYRHLAISPYPTQYVKSVTLRNGRQVTLRPIRPEDEALEAQMFEYLSKETVYFRFFGYIPQVTHEFLTRFTHIDYDREMAIVAEIDDDSAKQMIGVVRIVGDAGNEAAEYAIVIADAWQKHGLGSIMTDYIIEIARDKNYRKIYATLLKSNLGMKRLFEKKGFSITSESFDTYYAELIL